MTRADRLPPTPRRHTARRSIARPSAFTLIELLVVVGILGLLVALSVVGFRVVGGAAKSRVTGTALENCQGLVAEYKLTSQIDDLYDSSTIGLISVDPTTNVGSRRWEPAINNLTPSLVTCAAVSPGVIRTSGLPDPVAADRVTQERYLRDETARVIKRLMATPKNRASIEAMPSDRVAKVKYPTLTLANLQAVPTGEPPEYTAATPVIEGVVPVDGSGHPIYFIPGGGLMYVNVGYHGTGNKADKANYDRQVLIRATDRGPFWASPGPDGDLNTGDDNLYSTGTDTQ